MKQQLDTSKNNTDLILDKEEIISLSKNIDDQYRTLAEIVETRLHQTLFINEGLEKYSLKDFVSSKMVNDIAVALHGMIVNMEDVKLLISKIHAQYPELYENYSNYLELLEVENPGRDMDIYAAEIHDMLQPYLKATMDTSNKIDVLTETYTIEVQAKLDTIINTLAKANIYLDQLEKAENEINEEKADGNN